MRQRHLTAEATELIARTSLVIPTGVGKCGSHTYTFRACLDNAQKGTECTRVHVET